MDRKNYSNIGEQIKDTVQEAIDSMNFGQLNRNISDTVYGALDEAKRHIHQYNDSSKAYKEAPKKGGEGQVPVIKEKKGLKVIWKGRISGILYTVFGSIGMGVSAAILFLLLFIILSVNIHFAVASVAIGIIAACFGGFCMMLGVGTAIRGRLRRLRLYVKKAEKKMYCSLEELAKHSGKPRKFVIKELRKMIQIGMLPDAHIDEEETCLMFGEDMYQQYLETKEAMEERKKLERESLYIDRSGEELDQVLMEGQKYLQALKKANWEIRGEVISAKLVRLEKVIGEIFETIEQHPEQIDEMQKFMEYYLPTTVKLVDAYKDFDQVEIQGENIKTAKEEIEKTLDTINDAFETLLDDLYQDTAFDVTTDASVLQAMLEKEGLTGSDFKKNAGDRRM
ncbi:hypothetical protein D7X25_21880 [bacterium 1XD42-8]|jgi:5-bromo-4-chloroindolyl phosphate hydrolysis protein|nr:hypothetical protein [Lachnospiraceae bacterium]RKJ47646.1 hypothetical protein D7X25_21880 [bacterium 1XD42-8]